MDFKKLKRCTFAIISHPDAGKTTMTEKILWYGGVIHKVGMVKSKTGDFATSDWMELEKQRGISITSSVMSFAYQDRLMHLLDTPGHKDFSEDTYRTLTAVESVLMMIDSAKGVEAQTIKLMEVCRMRNAPMATFMNKLDRESLTPLDLIENVEKICSIHCTPITWPIGFGSDFKGIYHLYEDKIILFTKEKNPQDHKIIPAENLKNKELPALLGEAGFNQLKEDVEFIRDAIEPFSLDDYLAGVQTPVFFGTALYNFGVQELMQFLGPNAPAPSACEAITLDKELKPLSTRMVAPEEEAFSGFVFKVQANMDKKHRDRISFLRICSGEFKRNDKVFHVRTQKEVRIATPVFFVSRDREIMEEAYPGDIVGINGAYQIGDTFTLKENIVFTGIPSFAPEIFMKVTLKDPLKAKHLEKGLLQLSEEGAVQLFKRQINGDKILGAVGALQFDVVKFRLTDEYNVRADYEGLPFKGIRWPKFPSEKRQQEFSIQYAASVLFDHKGRFVVSFQDSWELKMMEEKNKDVHFYNNSDYR